MPAYDNIQSGSLSAPPAPYSENQNVVGLGKVLGSLAVNAAQDPTLNPDNARARLANSEAALNESKLTGQNVLANTMSTLADGIEANPALAADNIRKMAGPMSANAVRYGYDPEKLSQLMLGYASMAGTDQPTLMNLRTGTGKATGKDEALTQSGQDTIRAQDFAQQTSLEKMRADSAANVAQIHENAKTDPETKVGFKDMGEIDSEINAQLGISTDKSGKVTDGPGISPQLRAALRASATQSYKTGDDPATAVTKAISTLSQPQTEKGFLSRNFGGDGTTTIVPKQAPTVVPPGVPAVAPPSGGAPAPQPVTLIPQGGAPAAPAPASAPLPPGIPPAGARTIGGVYQTPRGPMMWTVTGWKPGA